MTRRVGNVPYLDIEEHNPDARAKRALIVGLDSGGADYRSPSVFDYVDSDPLSVVLVHPTTGVAYSATGGGGGGSSSTVTANLGVARDVTAYVAASAPLDIATLPGITGTVTAHIGGSVEIDTTSYPKKYSDIRTRTVYIPTEAGAARQINILTPGPWGWAITADPSNAEEIYLGPGSQVNSTPESSDSGWALYPGQTVILPLDNMTVYAVTPTVTAKAHLMTVVV